MAARGGTYFENLDPTRFWGFMGVFMVHALFTTNPAIEESALYEFIKGRFLTGLNGLDYFFTLSSFLLTWLALEERQSSGNFRPGLFLVRRGIRLWPLYFLLVGATYIIHPFIEGLAPLPPIGVFLLFHSNLWIIEHGQDFLFLLVFFWAISVEEQFYVFWAFVLKWLYRFLVPVCLLMIAGSLLFRYIHLDHDPALAFHTLSTLGNFGVGALTALAAFNNWPVVERIRTLSRKQILLVYAVLFVLWLFYFPLFAPAFMVVIEKLLFALFFAFVILEQSFARHSLFKLGKSRIITYLGQLSLGLYCYHGVVLTFVMPWLKKNGWADTPVLVYLLNPAFIFVLTVIISVLSYELMEKHIHSLRRYFYPRRTIDNEQ